MHRLCPGRGRSGLRDRGWRHHSTNRPAEIAELRAEVAELPELSVKVPKTAATESKAVLRPRGDGTTADHAHATGPAVPGRLHGRSAALAEPELSAEVPELSELAADAELTPKLPDHPTEADLSPELTTEATVRGTSAGAGGQSAKAAAARTPTASKAAARTPAPSEA